MLIEIVLKDWFNLSLHYDFKSRELLRTLIIIYFFEEGKVTEINSPVPSILDNFKLSAALLFASTILLFRYAFISFMSSTVQ